MICAFGPIEPAHVVLVLVGMTNRPSVVVVDPLPETGTHWLIGGDNGAVMSDIDGDGHTDYTCSPGFVLYGPLTSNSFVMATNSLDGTNGTYVNSITKPLVSLGDVNGDGREEVLTGNGILLGRTNKFPFAQAAASEVFNGTDGWAVAISGYAYSALGDFNGDGLADWACDRTLVFGTRTTLHGLSGVDGTNGIVFGFVADHPEPPYENFGTSMAGVGDVNGDGYADFAVACKLWNDKWYNYAQNCYIIYGRPVWSGREVVVSNAWFDAVRGFIVQDPPSTGTPREYWGPRSNIGNPLGGRGDFNGDGYDDPLIGCDGADELYVFFGGESPAWPPGLVAPQRVVDSTTGVWQYADETNVVVVGMKATNAVMYVWQDGIRRAGWEAGWGMRCFTNHVSWGAGEMLRIEYACSNALGMSGRRTVLEIAPVPEAGAGGLVLLALFTMYDVRRTMWGRSNHQGARKTFDI